MGELLIKPYEISVWEDKLTQDGFQEVKLAIIGSNTMDGPNKVYEPVFTKKANGEKTLTFSLKYKYYDPFNENEEVVNPFAALLVNERKVKLKYDDKWYEFIVKDHTESSDGLTWTYTCNDAFVIELSKNGYDITFDAELNNNQGTAKELAKETLKDTDWKLGGANVGKQLIEEPVYKAVLESTDVEIINASDDGTSVPSAGARVYVFYSYVKNQDGKFVQFIIRDESRQYTIDDKNVITDTNFRILTELTFHDNGFYKDNTLILSIGEIETKYHVNRLAYSQLTTYDPVMKRTVDRFQLDDREIYRYINNTYTTSNVVMNFITNGDNFNLLDDGSLQGWNPYNDVEGEGVVPLQLVTKPELVTGKELADIAHLSQIEGYLKAYFDGELTANYENTLFNSGIRDSARFIESIAQGEQFLFRWRAGKGEDVDDLVAAQNLGILIAKYTQDEINHPGYYYKHIDPDNVILRIEGTPQILNNIIKGGYLREETVEEIDEEEQVVTRTIHNYVIDDVVQTPSTKYVYINSTDSQEYVWNGLTGDFETVPNTYIPYYYLIGQAEKSIPNTVLTDTTEKIGIFVYVTGQDAAGEYFIQDIQLTRYLQDANGEPVLIGNVPTAVSKPTEYYYLKPNTTDKAEDVEMYTSVQDLLAALNSSGEVKPIYNQNSEKVLSISASQSNCFNILQTIAETFECWVDLVVEHDAAGKILIDENGGPRKYVYLNEYAGKDNYAGFKYATNLQSIERNINSDEIVTKLIVDQSQSEYVDEGYVSIANASSNQSGEAYILNFDYYYNQGLLDRESTEEDKNKFLSQVKSINLQLKEEEQKRRDLELAFTTLSSKRNVYTELVETAQDTKNQALIDFQQLTGQTYEDYCKDHPTLSEDDQLTEEETIFDILGELYSSSAVINNYSGLLTNIEQEYWNIRTQLRGSENYNVKVWVDTDELYGRHVFVELNDYLPGFSFTIDNDVYDSDVSTKYFDIITDAITITFSTPQGYTIDESSYQINDNKVAKFKITCNTTVPGIDDIIDEKIEAKKELTKEFTNKYRRFIQEGTWNSTDYIDSELYYLDALQVSNTSSQPVISYTINVVEISQLEGYEWYLFDAGDKSYVEDTEFFGWSRKNGILTPAREEVIVSQVEWHLDEPDKNIITVQNYKTRFEDFFQRVSAAVQTVQYNEATYAKISSLLDADGTINQNVLLDSLNRISGQNYNLTSDGSVQIKGDQILIQNLTNLANLVKIDSEGIRISSDGGQSWTTAISGRGINIGTVYTGRLNTDEVIIGSEDNPSFRWDKSGISAYEIDQNSQISNLKTYVRYDQYGLYGIKNNGTFKAQSLQDVKDNAHFAVTWDGFFIKNSYEGGGQVSITSENDFQVLQSGGAEKIKIGALEWEDSNGDITTDPTEGVGAPTLYGIRIRNDAGDEVMKTDDEGNITITGTINANAGNIGGMEVNNDWMRMKYIVFEPNKGIYSTYPNQKGKTPVDPSVTVPPFIISDTDGSATFNNVIVRGSIKTSVFEYEEIQAVGGAFLFRPSSAIRQASVNGADLDLVVEKGGLFKVGDWLKVSNFNSATTQDGITPDELNGFGLTYIYEVKSANGTHLTLKDAAAMLVEQGLTTEDLVGGSVIDFGRHASKQVEADGETYTIDIPGDNNYGIGINSSDGFINLPPRAISLFETVIHPNYDPKVSYRFRGILGTLPDPIESNIEVNNSIYSNMVGTQGIYTNNMYIGDLGQYIAFYEEDGKKQLKIKANQIVFEVTDDEGQGTGTYQDIAEFDPEGTPGPAGQDAITVRIESSVGNEFVMSNEQTRLTCMVYQGSTDITNTVTKFTWTKLTKDGTPDTTWNQAHENYNDSYIDISANEVNVKAIFNCHVTIPES